MLNIFLYAVGWLLYVAAQAQNSIASTSNGLAGAAGLKFWLSKQTVNLLTRAFFSSLAYGFIVHTMTAKIQAVGFPIESAAIAGAAGYSANALLYQFLGLFPGLRVEMSTLAPPETPAANTAGKIG